MTRRALVLVLLLLAGPAWAGPREDLRRAGEAASAGEFRERVRAVRAQVPQAPPEVLAALEAAEEAPWPEEALEEVAAAEEGLESWLAAGEAAPASAEAVGAARARLDSVLQQPEFTASARAQTLAGRVERALKDFFGGLFSGGGEPEVPSFDFPGRALAYGLVIALLLGLVAGLVALVRRRRRRAPGEARPDDGSRHESLERTSRGWLEAAEEHAGRGDHRTALRFLYLGLLRKLDELGVLSLEANRTNWELLDALGEDPRRPDLEAATLLFESHWYALRQASPEDFRDLRERYHRLVEP